MKNLKKISRNNLKTIKGGTVNECAVDSDCPVTLESPCAICTQRPNGMRYCLSLFVGNCVH